MSSSGSSGSWEMDGTDCEDFRRGLADVGEDIDRLRPNAAAADCFLVFLTRDERAEVT